MLAQPSLALATTDAVDEEKRLELLKAHAREKLKVEVASKPRGYQAQLAKRLRVSSAHVANMVNKASGPGEQVLPKLLQHWGMSRLQLEIEAGVAREWHPTLSMPPRYAALDAVRAMGRASNMDERFVESFEVALDADEQPEPDYLWTLMKAAWARHQRKASAKGDPTAGLDVPVRNTRKKPH